MRHHVAHTQSVGRVSLFVFASAIIAALTAHAGIGQERDVFEVASIKLASPPRGGGGRGNGGSPCGGITQIENNRFVARGVSAYTLIAIAYGKHCLVEVKSGLISGGPEWLRSDRFEIQALIPQGAPTYTSADLRAGKALKLQTMLRSLLADRFKLIMHGETKEIAVYALTVAKGGSKLQPLQEGNCVLRPSPPPEPPKCGRYILRFGPFSAGSAGNFDSFAFLLSLVLDRPVVDKTGITGTFDFVLRFAADEHTSSPDELAALPPSDPGDPSVFTAIQEQLGLKLEAAKAPMEVLIIDHAEKPTPN